MIKNTSIKKKVLSILLVGVASVLFLWSPHVAHAACSSWDVGCKVSDAIASASQGLEVGIYHVIGYIAYMCLFVSAWILSISGLVFDYVMQFTVVNMASQISSSAAACTASCGLGNAINISWTTLRDVGNLIFIFILLYVAIQTILGLADGNTKRLIRNVIIVGLLVNFSLFFTKFLIDGSNIISIVFYNHIVGPTATASSFTTAFAAPLGVQSLYGTQSATQFVATYTGLDVLPRLVINAMGGSIFLGVTALTFLTAAALFAFRFIILILLMILSPLAFFMWILPNTKQYANRWWQTLAGQLIFAPLYMALIWVVAILVNTAFAVTNTANLGGLGNSIGSTLTVSTAAAASATGLSGAIGSIFDFVIIIGFMWAATIIAVQQASKGGGMVASVVEKATGTFGPQRILSMQNVRAVGNASANAAASGTAALGRTTVGRVSNSLSSEDGRVGAALKRGTASNNKYIRAISDKTLNTLNTGATASFDARNTTAGKNLGLVGKGEGGYRGIVQKKSEEIVKSIKERGGVSSKTRSAINDATNDLEKNRDLWASTQSMLIDAEKSGDQSAITRAKANVASAAELMRDSQKKVDRLNKTKTQEIQRQRIRLAQHLKSGRMHRSIGETFEYQKAYDDAFKQVIQKEKPANDKDKEKAEIGEFEDRLKAALDTTDKDVSVQKVLSSLDPKYLGKVNADTFFNTKDGKVTGAHDIILDKLSNDQLKAIKGKVKIGDQTKEFELYEARRKSKQAAKNPPAPAAPQTPAPAPVNTSKPPVSNDDIARRAYEISQSGTGGSEHDNWLRAESELKAK
jgi:hypothetical protein